ncbi:MAG: hypothetical protein ACP5N3_04390 [Candidatus Nanoarchaeia archaeon]
MTKTSEYFLNSQKIKKEIESDLELLKNIESCFSGNNLHFAKGTTNEIYLLGKTKSGEYLALRKEIWPENLEDSISRFETYCQTADTIATTKSKGLFKYRKRTVNFCIGVLFNSKIAGIITEDISEGNKYGITNEMGDYAATRIKNDEVIDEILVDLDNLKSDGYFHDDREIVSTTKYFSPKHRLEIKKQN